MDSTNRIDSGSIHGHGARRAYHTPISATISTPINHHGGYSAPYYAKNPSTHRFAPKQRLYPNKKLNNKKINKKKSNLPTTTTSSSSNIPRNTTTQVKNVINSLSGNALEELFKKLRNEDFTSGSTTPSNTPAPLASQAPKMATNTRDPRRRPVNQPVNLTDTDRNVAEPEDTNPPSITDNTNIGPGTTPIDNDFVKLVINMNNPNITTKKDAEGKDDNEDNNLDHDVNMEDNSSGWVSVPGTDYPSITFGNIASDKDLDTIGDDILKDFEVKESN